MLFVVVALWALGAAGAPMHNWDPEEKTFFELKCSACSSVVAELERNLETEKPKMNVDLRRSLAGNNKGKIVDYAVSELRTLELLEGVCQGMTQYGVTTLDDGSAGFQRHGVADGTVKIVGTMTIGTEKYNADKQQLKTYCETLVEQHEDLLSEAIRAAGLLQLQKKEEEKRQRQARVKGHDVADADPYEVLGVVKGTSFDGVKQAYRHLSRQLHPDKTGGDPELLKRFVAVTAAYEKVTGHKHEPYEDLYRQVCVDIVGVCKSDADVDHAKRFFPRYHGSLKFNTIDGVVDHEQIESPEPKKRRRRRRKTSPKTNAL